MTNAERKVIRELEGIHRSIGQVQREQRLLREDPPGQGRKLDEIQAYIAAYERETPPPGTKLVDRLLLLLNQLDELRPPG